jgi:hypothetical protein
MGWAKTMLKKKKPTKKEKNLIWMLLVAAFQQKSCQSGKLFWVSLMFGLTEIDVFYFL